MPTAPPALANANAPPTSNLNEPQRSPLPPQEPNATNPLRVSGPWLRVQNISARPILTQTEFREGLITYEVHTIQIIKPQNPNQEKTWAQCSVARESLNVLMPYDRSTL